MDSRIDDVCAGGGEPGADTVEQALPVGREDADRASRRFRGSSSATTLGLGIADMRLGRGDLARIGDLPVERLGKPVAVGQPPGVRPRGARFPAQRRGQLLLPLLDQFVPPALLVAEPQPLLGGIEQGAQQACRFQSFQTPGPTARISTTVRISSSRSRSGLCTCADEILDRLGVGEVALEGGRRHQQMMADQPGDGLGLGRRRARSAGKA